jgi:hypothetical protein
VSECCWCWAADAGSCIHNAKAARGGEARQKQRNCRSATYQVCKTSFRAPSKRTNINHKKKLRTACGLEQKGNFGIAGTKEYNGEEYGFLWHKKSN